MSLSRERHRFARPACVIGSASILSAAGLTSGSTDLGDAVMVLNLISLALVAYDLGPEAGVLGATTAAAIAVFWSTSRGVQLGPMSDTALAGAYLGTAFFVGSFGKHLSDGSDLRSTESRRALAVERERLAHDVHDVVTHSLTAMTVQAAGAQRVMRTDQDRAVGVFAAIEQCGREALDELRHLLDAMQPTESTTRGASSPLGLGDLPVLMRHVDQAGIRIRLRIHGHPHPLPAQSDLSGYRIVQEALTNVMKHVGECNVWVTVRYQARAVVVDVRDDGGKGSPPRILRPGNGLLGIKDRAARIGGELEAGRCGDRGYRVRLRLPIEP